MTKTMSNGTSPNCNLNANEEFVLFLTSKLNYIFFIEGFTLGMKSKSIEYLIKWKCL